MTTPSIAPGGGVDQQPEPIDGPTALRLLREVVAEQPERVYVKDEGGNCHYFRDGKPSCVVGHVLARAGRRAAGFLDYTNTQRVMYLNDPLIDDAAASILQAAQDAQDTAAPWATALDEAERDAARIGVTA